MNNKLGEINNPMRILGIETSCDETAAAIVENGVHEVASVVASSRELHEKTGGVVPEVAARKQVESIVPVLNEVLEVAKMTQNDIDALAVTVGPGLIGSLLVGVEAAKALSLAWSKPLIPVNHLVGHIYANFVDNPKPVELPAVALVVSGGHTDLVLMQNHGNLQYLGGTLDDAAGEAFDKTARLLGLADYLGGPLLSAVAEKCEDTTLTGTLPRPKINDNDLDFSFSGLKTAVKRLVEKNDLPVECVAKEFEDAVVDVLVKKTLDAVKQNNVQTILLGGGVSANSQLRKRLGDEAEKLGFVLHIPPMPLCTDNAVYIASAAYFSSVKKPLAEIQADPGLGITDLV